MPIKKKNKKDIHLIPDACFIYKYYLYNYII